MFITLAAAAVFASSAYAQGGSLNISSTCQNTLAGLATSPDAQCLNAPGLLTAFATLSADSSIIPAVNSWTTGMCSQAACSNQTLAALVGNVTSGCASDLAALGFQSSDEPGVVAEVQMVYPTVREVLCLKNSTSNNLCITDILTIVQNATGTLSENNISKLVASTFGNAATLQSALMSAVCSDCVKAAINVIEKNFPGTLPASDKQNLTSTCGATFVDGQNPPDVTQTASGLSSANSNSGSNSGGSSTRSGALAMFPVTTLAIALSALASAFAFFA